MTNAVKDRPRSRPRRRDREPPTTGWRASKVLIFGAFVALGISIYVAWQPVVNPGVQDCGTSISFFMLNKTNVVLHPGENGESLDSLALAAQPTCRDLAIVELKKASVGVAAFFGLAFAGVLVGLVDDRIAYWRAPKYETLLRGMAREDRVRFGLVPNVDVKELGIRLPPVESLDVLAIVMLGGAALLVLPFIIPVDLTEQAATHASLVPLLAAIVVAASTFVASAVGRKALYPDSDSWGRAIELSFASAWAGRLRPLLGSFGLDVHHLRRAGVRRREAVLDVQVLQTVSLLMHLVLLVVAGLLVARQPLAYLRIEPPMMAAGAVLGLLVLNGLTRLGRVVRGLPVRPSVAALGALARIAGTPRQLAELFGGTLLVTVGYVGVLAVSVAMFGGSASWSQLGFVYLAVVVIGAVATTPSGVGAVELAMALLLMKVGVEPGAAVCATIMFRVATFWLPLLPGWSATRRLRVADAI